MDVFERGAGRGRHNDTREMFGRSLGRPGLGLGLTGTPSIKPGGRDDFVNQKKAGVRREMKVRPV